MCDEVLFREVRPHAHFPKQDFITHPLFSYSVNSKQIMDLHFNQQHLLTFCVIFLSCHPPAMSSDFISRHGFSMCRKVGNKSLRISWPLAKKTHGSTDAVLQPREEPFVTSEIWNLNQPKCGQMKKWDGAWQETCNSRICNSRAVVYWQRSRNSKLWKVVFRHVAQNANKFCCKKADMA